MVPQEEGLMKAFMEPVAPQRSEKKRFKLLFTLIQISKMHGMGGVSIRHISFGYVLNASIDSSQ